MKKDNLGTSPGNRCVHSLTAKSASLGTHQAAFVSGGMLVGVPETRALTASFLYQRLRAGVTFFVRPGFAAPGASIQEIVTGRNKTFLRVQEAAKYPAGIE
ncbi:hypothetical protein EDD75_1308 [Thermodesulfitimonas autotrophica]|uniref:Uncharacterized protein n=1 Tax=Thermodesulfitimonas autotrophica TaxID=1894989 RepID=A0A3N5AQA3_9THEO|nr:hypothetical protein EDD75_1308 [Thermodesulfitimonas autotrophica]